jgi:magnesium chelatase subunit H
LRWQDGAKQADLLIDGRRACRDSVALVLWGSDNIKSDGGPIGQALALMGAKPRFDGVRAAVRRRPDPAGRARPAAHRRGHDAVGDLPRSAAAADPDAGRGRLQGRHRRRTGRHELRPRPCARLRREDGRRHGGGRELRVFSNAEGAYGSNVNALVDSGAWGAEDELADAYQARKSFAYGMDGKAKKNARALLQAALKDVDLAYQNLESVELGVTTVDHYFDTLGGIARAVKRAKGGEEAPGSSSATDPRRGQGAHPAGSGGAGDPLAQPEPEMVRGAAEARP